MQITNQDQLVVGKAYYKVTRANKDNNWITVIQLLGKPYKSAHEFIFVPVLIDTPEGISTVRHISLHDMNIPKNSYNNHKLFDTLTHAQYYLLEPISYIKRQPLFAPFNGW